MKIDRTTARPLPPFHDAPVADVQGWLRDHEGRLREHLLVHGVALIRGAGIDSGDRLHAFASALSPELGSYKDGNSPRTKVRAGVYTSTEYAQDAFISLHNELSYASSWPSTLFFCCITAPAAGEGHTLLADSREILRRIDPDVRALFVARGVRYVRNLHDGSGVLGKSWQQTFETDSRAEVEQYCADHQIRFEWSTQGLRLVQLQPATRRHPVSGDEVWFNQADQFHPSTNEAEVYEALRNLFPDPQDMPHYACFGDGSEIGVDVLEHVRAVAADAVRLFDWRAGDVLVVDNMLCAHGRSPYSGDRRILVSMA